MKNCSFENQTESSNGIQKISMKSSNGSGILNVMCIDLSQSSISYDLEYILENFGNYYFGLTAAQMNGITEDDFVSNYRMINSVLSKGKYQRYGSVQKTDGIYSDELTALETEGFSAMIKIDIEKFSFLLKLTFYEI